MPASPLHRVVSPCVGAIGHTPRGYQSRTRLSLHRVRPLARDDAALHEPTKAFRSASNAGIDDADPEAAIDSRDPPTAEAHLAKPDSDARNAGLLDASSIGAAAGVQVVEGFLDQPIQPTCSLIRGDLVIPRSRIKFCIPSAKRRHIVRRQLLDRGFDFFHCAHG